MINTIAVIACIVLFIVIWALIDAFFFRRKLLKISTSRPALNRFDFIDKMELEGFEYDKIVATYDAIKELLQLDEFHIYPTDNLLKLYKMDDLDIYEMIVQLCEQLEVNYPSQEQHDEVFQLNNENFDTIFILRLLHQGNPVKKQ